MCWGKGHGAEGQLAAMHQGRGCGVAAAAAVQGHQIHHDHHQGVLLTAGEFFFGSFNLCSIERAFVGCAHLC